jgi:cell division protein FtsB
LNKSLCEIAGLILKALRMVQNALRKEVNRLNEENDKLSKEVTVLEQEVQRINEKETELEQITQKQNINSNTFIQLCNTNRVTLDELKVILVGT